MTSLQFWPLFKYFFFEIISKFKKKKSLLCDPNPNSPANSEAAKLYQEDRKEYIRRVKFLVLVG